MVLLDSDPEGQKVAEGLIKQWIMKDRHVLLLGNVIERSKETTLEDLLTTDFYLKYVNQAYEKELDGSSLTVAEVEAVHHPQVVLRIDEVMRARGLKCNTEGWEFNKGRPAKKMMEDLAKKTLVDLPENMIENFKKLFMAVNAAMPTLVNQRALTPDEERAA